MNLNNIIVDVQRDRQIEVFGRLDYPTKLDIGCGQQKQEGFTGIDLCEGADIKWDLTRFPWPIGNECVMEARCCHVLEHINDINGFMAEIYRILVRDGVVTIQCPYYANQRAVQDPTHVRFISENTFGYYNKEWREQNKVDHYGSEVNFKIEKTQWIVSDQFKSRLLKAHGKEWEKCSQVEKEWYGYHCINVIDDIVVQLRKI